MSVEVRVVGSMEVRRGGHPISPTEIGSRKARMLLAFLAVNAPRLVPVDRIIDVLWVDTPPREPVQNVATLVSRLRAVLGRDALVGGRNAYGLAVGVGIDLRRAANIIAEAETHRHDNPRKALTAAQRAVSLLAGGPVENDGGVLDDLPFADWAQTARRAHLLLLRRARHACAAAALELRRPEIAQGAAESALRADMLDEIACRLAMRAYAAAGEPARAMEAFGRLRNALAEDLGVDPSPETRALHIQILRSNIEDEPPGPAASTSDPVGVPRETRGQLPGDANILVLSEDTEPRRGPRQPSARFHVQQHAVGTGANRRMSVRDVPGTPTRRRPGSPTPPGRAAHVYTTYPSDIRTPDILGIRLDERPRG